MHSGRGKPPCPPVLHSVAAAGLPAFATQIHSSGWADSFSSHIPDQEKKATESGACSEFIDRQHMLLYSLNPSVALH